MNGTMKKLMIFLAAGLMAVSSIINIGGMSRGVKTFRGPSSGPSSVNI
jgi:hypothetical protein